MKIGIDARFWNQTGVGRYTSNLIKELQKIDKKNEYVLFVKSGDKTSIKKDVKNKNFRLVVADIKWHSLKEQFIFPKIIYQENLDLMHFPYFSVPVFYNRQYIVTIHDLIIDHHSTGKASTLPMPIYKLKKLGYKLVIKRVAKKAMAIIVPSEATKTEVISHLKVSKDRIYITHEGSEIIDKSKFTDKENKEKYFLYVGNAYPHKNLESLIKAFKNLNNQFKDLKLFMVGKEDYFYKRIRDKINENGLSKSIILTGRVTDEKLKELYKRAIALVMPSFMEGFGLPVIEAISNKCLVLASNIPAIKEICRNDAVYFDPYDIFDMEEKMIYVYKKKKSDFKNKIESAYSRASKFSWKKTAIETFKIYESCFSLRQDK